MEKDWDKFPFVQEEPRNIDFGFKMAGGSVRAAIAWQNMDYKIKLKILSIFTETL